MAPVRSDALVFLGATGDLAYKQIFPALQGLVRDGMKAGALGLSVSRNQGHFDPQGVHIPALWADEKEIFALAWIGIERQAARPRRPGPGR